MPDVEALLREAETLHGMRALHEHDWRSIAQTMIPAQSDISGMRHAGARRTDRIYDPTGMLGVMRLSSFLQSMMINFSSRWFSLKMRLLETNQEANLWLDDVSEIMTSTYNNNTSPISQAVFEMFLQYVGLGTGGLFVDEAPMTFLNEPTSGFRGYFARSLPVGTYDIGEGPMGTSDTLFRRFEATPHQMEQQFGFDSLSDRMKTQLQSGNSQQRHLPAEILHAVKPRPGRDRTRRDQMNMPWSSSYIDVPSKHLLDEGGFQFFPFMTPRWSKIIPHTPWGFGPGHMALPDVLSLNLIDQDILRALPMAIFPPGFLEGANQDLVTKVSLVPAVINPMPTGGRWTPYASGIDLQKEILQVQERQDRVREIFFLDLLQTLPDVNDSNQMTATEVLERQRIMSQIMGPALRRWLAEFLNPFIDTTFSIGLQAGLFPDPPQSVIDVASIAGGQIDVEYEGILSRAQRLDSVQSIDDGLLTAASLSQQLGDPLLIRNIDVDAAFQERLRASGMPAHLIRDVELVIRERQEQINRQEEQLAAEGVRADAAALGDAAPALQAVREVAA